MFLKGRARVLFLCILVIGVIAGVLRSDTAAGAFSLQEPVVTSLSAPVGNPIFTNAAIAGVVDPRSKISPDVLRDTADGKRASVVILLSEQADVRAAYDIKDEDARGWYVYNTLTEHADRTQSGLRSMLQAEGTAYQPYWAANMIIATADRWLVERLAARPDVARIDSNKPTRWIEDPAIADERPSDSEPEAPGAIEWGVSNVNAPQVWALGFKGQGIVVGGLDTGIRWTHNALKPKYRGWNGTTADHNYNWHDAIHSGGGVCGANTTAPCDDNGHGTHTVGTMLGDDGGTNQVGVAPDAKWIGCRNMNVGDGTPATYTECFQFMIAPTNLAGNSPDPTRRPHVLNNSWGCPASEGCTTRAELEAIVSNTQAAGIFVEVSAGNAGPACSTVVDAPAIYSDSFSTGSITSTNAVSSFSSRGPSTYYNPALLKPNIVAPGSSVRSATRSSDSAFMTLSGTSMAGPHVAGVIALLWSARPHLSRDIAATKTLLQNTANPNVTLTTPQTCGGISSTQIPNNSFGYGRVDALAAVNGAPTPTPTATPTATPPAVISGRITYENALVPTVPIPSVTITANGSPQVMGISNQTGNYELTGLGAGPYTVTPARPPQPTSLANGIFSNDAAMIARHLVGLTILTSSQLDAARVAGQSSLSALDAAYVAQYVVGNQSLTNQTGSWAFAPINRTYPSVAGSLQGQNFTAILKGDVSGDWSPSAGRPLLNAGDRLPWDAVLASVPRQLTARTGSEIVVPLRLDDLRGTGITSFQFDIEYDPTIISPVKIAADISGTMSQGLTVFSNAAKPGLLKVVVFGAVPASGDGEYVNLSFTAIGRPGSSSKVNITGFRFNDGLDPVVTANGTVTITPR